MKRVQLVTTTMTYANKAKALLKDNGIEAEIRKVQGGTALGCLYGIIISVPVLQEAEMLLNAENIRIISKKEVQI